MYNQPGRMVGRFALNGDRTLFLFVFKSGTSDPPIQLAPAVQKAILRETYAKGQWECQRILDQLDVTRDLYFDRVSQVKMTAWSRGRIGLVGDAAFCVSLASRQGRVTVRRANRFVDALRSLVRGIPARRCIARHSLRPRCLSGVNIQGFVR